MDDDQKACPYCGCDDAHWVEVKQWDCETVGGCSVQAFNELKGLRKALEEIRSAAHDEGGSFAVMIARKATAALEEKAVKRCESTKGELRCDLEAGHSESHHAIERMDTSQW